MLRILLLSVVAMVLAPAQVLTEVSAAAAGGLVGGAAGKPVSEGVASVFSKVDQLTKDAADDKNKGKEKAKSGPAVQIGPGQAASTGPSRGYSVPPPPPARNAVRFAASRIQGPMLPPPPVVFSVEPVAEPVAVPSVTVASIQPGMDRDEVRKIVSPAVHITMYDDGHLVEVYRYKEGVIRLSDGAVASVTRR